MSSTAEARVAISPCLARGRGSYFKLSLIFVASSLSLTAQSFAQVPPTNSTEAHKFKTDCNAYEGKTVAFRNPEEIITQLLTLQKGEFETQAQFDSRVRKAREGLGRLAIIRTSSSPSGFVYDADTKKAYLDPKYFGYDSDDTATTAAAMSLRLDLFSKMSRAGHTYTLSKTTTHLGRYAASTVFGGKISVVKEKIHYSMLYDFDDISIDGAWEIRLTVAEAKQRRAFSKQAFLVDLDEAKAFRTINDAGKATLTDPVELTLTYSVLFAHILCGFNYANSGKILDTVNWEDED